MEQYTSARPTSEPISAEDACAAPLEALPRMIRAMADEVVRLKHEWLDVYGNYRERKASLTLYFHTDERLGIMAAGIKAGIDPHIIEAGANSQRLRQRIAAFENAEQHLMHELQVRVLMADHPAPPRDVQ